MRATTERVRLFFATVAVFLIVACPLTLSAHHGSIHSITIYVAVSVNPFNPFTNPVDQVVGQVYAGVRDFGETTEGQQTANWDAQVTIVGIGDDMNWLAGAGLGLPWVKTENMDYDDLAKHIWDSYYDGEKPYPSTSYSGAYWIPASCSSDVIVGYDTYSYTGTSCASSGTCNSYTVVTHVPRYATTNTSICN